MACQSAKNEADAPNIELLAGDFDTVSWGGAQVDRFHVVARRRENDDVVIWSPDRPETCSLGPIAWYDTNQPVREGGLAWGALGKAIVPFIGVLDDQGRGTLSFSGADCKPLGLQIEDVDPSELWTAYDSSYLAPSYLARTRDQRLLLGDLGKMEAREIAHDVGEVDLLDEGMWLIESGQAVFRDAAGAEQARTGQGVTQIIAMGQDEIVYIADNALFHYVSGRPLKRFATNVDSVAVLSGFSGFTLAYLTGQGTLMIDDGKRTPWLVATDCYDFISTGGFVLFGSVGATPQGLASSRPSGSTLALASSRAFESTKPTVEALSIGWPGRLHFDTLTKRAGNKLLLMARPQLTGASPADGSSSPGSSKSLVLLDIDTDLLSVTAALSDSPSVMLTNFGSDTRLSPPVVMARSFAGRLLTLDDTGSLELRRLRDLGLVYRASNVSSGSIRTLFGDSEPALGYLRNVDETSAGDLELYFVERGERRKVASHVRELHQVWWPETGVLYSTAASAPGGAALWFAHVTLPCSQTTGAPWTCL